MSQVLTESVTLSTMRRRGRASRLARCIGQGISAVTPLPARLELWSVALGIGITAAVGLFFGLYPALARRAPRSDRSPEARMMDMGFRVALLRRNRRAWRSTRCASTSCDRR